MRKQHFMSVATVALFIAITVLGITKGFDWLTVGAIIICGLCVALEIREGLKKND
jgi:hypothetical protein